MIPWLHGKPTRADSAAGDHDAGDRGVAHPDSGTAGGPAGDAAAVKASVQPSQSAPARQPGARPGGAPPVPRPGPVTETTFLHVASGANSTYDWTDLDHPMTNGNPAALVFATPNWSPHGTGAVYDDHPIGVYYHDNRWSIFHQDQTPIPAGAAFNVHVVSAPTPPTALVHSAAPGTHYTDVDTAAANGRPGALVWITANYNPAFVYDSHPTGVWYNGGRWSIFNQDIAAMPAGAAFNVSVGTKTARTTFVHIALAANSNSNYTNLNSPAVNGHPNALILVTPNYNPGGSGGTYDQHNIGVWYHDGVWSVFNQDMAAMPPGAGFNIAVYGS
jgi:hypothetical protein